MSNSISILLTRNLHDVFGENDSVRRRAAVDQIFTADCVFYEPKVVYRGRGAGPHNRPKQAPPAQCSAMSGFDADKLNATFSPVDVRPRATAASPLLMLATVEPEPTIHEAVPARGQAPRKMHWFR